MRHLTRVPAVLLGAALIAAISPGVALAAPANDDFGSATEITALPFRTTIDTTGATWTHDDPYACDTRGEGSVWLRYTAPAAGIVRLSVRSTGTTPAFAVFTGERGALTPVPGTCSIPSSFEDTFHVEAGTTYHIALMDWRSSMAGPLALGLTAMAPESNDNRVSARVTGLPATLEGDLRRATAEPGEAPPSCDPTAVRSLWYRYTATKTRFVNVKTNRTAITVHRQDEAAEIDCVPVATSDGVVFHAVQGETYLIRVADWPRWAETFLLDVGTAASIGPEIRLVAGSGEPAVGTDIEFWLWSGDPHRRDLVNGTLTFGDGTSAPFVPGQRILHRYAQAGAYEVTITGSTKDGRSGTGSVRFSVK